MKEIIQIQKSFEKTESSKSMELLDDNLEYNKPLLLKLKNSIGIEGGTSPSDVEASLPTAMGGSVPTIYVTPTKGTS